MMRILSIVSLAGFLALAGACGSSADGTAPPDAASPQGDAMAPVDDDHDGHVAADDCDDHDPAVWQRLAYSYRDADGDGRTVKATGTVCAGASLPAGYAVVPGDPDCDDTDATVFAAVSGYPDSDGDGRGAGPAMAFCTSGALPAGFVAASTVMVTV